MLNRSRFLLTALVLGFCASSLVAETKAPAWPKPKPSSHDYAKWEQTIAGFEKADTKSPPPKGSVIFVGSSTIVRWKTLTADFPDVPVLNRGFGGNQIKDNTYYAERMIFSYEPKAIFLRAGGNDINAGWPAEEVFADYKAFVTKMRTKFPDIPITFVGLSPTIKRLEQVAEGDRLNAMIADYCSEKAGLTYIDCSRMTLDSEGKVRPELLHEDKLHLSPEGYRLLADAVRPYLPE